MQKPILIYDLQSLPDLEKGITHETVFEFFEDKKIVLWDSSNEGQEPKVISAEESVEYKIIDLKNVDKSEIEKL